MMQVSNYLIILIQKLFNSVIKNPSLNLNKKKKYNMTIILVFMKKEKRVNINFQNQMSQHLKRKWLCK